MMAQGRDENVMKVAVAVPPVEEHHVTHEGLRVPEGSSRAHDRRDASATGWA